jgi:hypothetical protein
MARRTWIAALALSLVSGAGLVVAAPDLATAAKKPHKPAKPVIKKIDPATGSAAGGTLVTIKGKHLKTAKKVLFGKTKGTELKVKSDKKLTVVAPPHATGTVDVVVRTKGGKSAKSSKARFSYVNSRPQVTGVSPNTGPDTGGTVVTVTGSGFAGVTAVTFEGTPGTSVQVISPDRLTVVSPEHAPGLVNVQVPTAAGTSPAKTDLFRFTNVVRSTVAPVPADAAADPRTDLADVECPEIGICFAVGYYFQAGVPDTRRPLIEQRTGTESWAAISPALPAGAAADPDARLVDIACPTTTTCVAVGAYQTTASGYVPLVATFDGTGWTFQAVPLPVGGNGAQSVPIEAVDCPSTTTCVGVGSDYTGAVHRSLVITLSGGSWTSQALTSPVGIDPGGLADVSCGTPTDCVAVGAGDDGLGGQVPLMATLSGINWTVSPAPIPVDTAPTPDAFLEAVSCTAATTCTAVGKYTSNASKELGLTLQETLPGVWGQIAISGPADSRSEPGIRLHAISCVTGLDCLAVGEYVAAADNNTRPFLVPLGAGGADPFAGPVPPSTAPDEALNDVVCVVITACAAVGRHQSAPGVQVPLFETIASSGRAAGAAPTPAGWDHGELSAVTGDGPTALGVGRYTDSGGVTRGVITIDIPIS